MRWLFNTHSRTHLGWLTAIVAVVVVLFFLPSLARAAPILNSATGHYYERIDVAGGLTWDQAKLAAESRSVAGVKGHLMTVTSANEQKFLEDNLLRPGGPVGGAHRYWLGGYQPSFAVEPAGNWSWVTKEPWSYSNWFTGEPNDNLGNEDVLQIGYRDRFTAGEPLTQKWNDIDRNGSTFEFGGYYVEYETSTNNSRSYVSQKPSGRLAEWDQTAHQWVEPNDLSSGTVCVLTHGWGNGELGWVQSHPGQDVWDMRTSVTTGTDFFDSLQEVVDRIDSVGATDHILAYSWIDLSATALPDQGAGYSKGNTGDAAAYLVRELKKRGIGPSTEKIHLLGHSHGARVVTLAAADLEDPLVGAQVDQLTLWDSPDDLRSGVYFGAANNLNKKLSLLDIGTGSGQTFVDNYISEFGTPYSDVVNVKLFPDEYGATSSSAGHGYPVSWYADATLHSNGFAWASNSFLPQFDAYYQDSQYEYALLDTQTYVTRRYMTSDMTMTTVGIEGEVSLGEDGATLNEHSPAFWDLVIDLDAGDVTIEFDYEFHNIGDGDQLGIWIDDALRLILTGELAGQGLQSTSIDVSDLDVGQHLMTVALHSTGDANAIVYAGNFQTITVVPEPTTLSLLAFSTTLLLTGRRRRD